MMRFLISVSVCVWTLATVTPAIAQDWPVRPVKIVVPYPAGGGVDILARALSMKLQEKWQQPVTIENRPGANTLIGAEHVARSSDGHTLLLTTDATFSINPHLFDKLPYSPENDFLPITKMVSFSQMLVVNAALPVENLSELIAMARAQPGRLSYASYGPGSQPQLATEILKQKAGIFILHIPYRGIPQAVHAVVSGEVPMTWSGIPSARIHLANQRIKALAYGGKTRSSAYPLVPTVSELGYPDVDANVWIGLFAPVSMGNLLVNKVHNDVNAVLKDSAFRVKEIDDKAYNFSGMGPREFGDHIRKETASRAGPVKFSGAKVE